MLWPPTPDRMSVRSILLGSLGFAFVSLAAFSLWAFGGRWFHAHGGDAAMYPAIALVFLGLTGLVLQGLMRGGRRLARFYSAFVPAFFAYAVVWCLAWFLIKKTPGEWVGSLVGSFVFALVVMKRLGAAGGFSIAALLVFAAHSAGYFAGGKLMYGILGGEFADLFDGWSREAIKSTAMLSWGLCYGLGFGAGIGVAFERGQRKSSPVTP